MTIGIMGTPVSSGNRGVEALGASLLNLCAKADPGVRMMLLLGHKDSQPARFNIQGCVREVPVVNARMSPRSRLREHLFCILFMAVLYRLLPFGGVRKFIASNVPWIAALLECDVVGDVRGGDSFSDIYGLGRFLLGCIPAATVLLVKGSMVHFPQTFGPYKHAAARHVARILLKNASFAIARDAESRGVAASLSGEKTKLRLTADVAFTLNAVRPAEIRTNAGRCLDVP